MGFEPEDRARLHRGAVITLLGRLSFVTQASFVLVANFLFEAHYGTFALAFNVVGLLSSFVVSGFSDAITYFASRHAAAKRETELYQALAVCLVWPLAMSIVAALGITLSAEFLYRELWAERFDRDLVLALQLMAWGLPLMVLVKLPAEAVRAHMDMRWSTAIEICLPLVNFGTAVAMAFTDLGTQGLVMSWLLAQVGGGAISLYGFTRYYRIDRTIRALRGRPPSRDILAFALPQSVNMMFNYGLVRIDALMLSLWYGPEVIAVYTVVSEMVRAIREGKQAFVGVFAPLVAKYKELDNRHGIQESLHEVARLSSLMAIPLLVGTTYFYPEAVLFEPGRAWPHSPWFPWLLAAGPLMSCFFGLAGNLLLMSGHSRLLLWNSTLMVVINIVLNALWIPNWGMLGAAAATMIAGVFLSILQMIEMARLERLYFSAASYTKPMVGLLLAIGVGAWINGPTGHAWIYGFGPMTGLAIKVGFAIAVVVAFGGIVFGWPGDNRERAWLVARWEARRVR